jgi:hypothetical protein
MFNVLLISGGVLFVLIVGKFLWARVQHGSWTGALFEGSVELTHGEVRLLPTHSRNEVLKVIALRNKDGESLVGLVVSDNAPLAVSATPYRLTKDQAQKLAGLLATASR